MNPTRTIWITWENHRRTTELANLLPDLKLFVIQMNASRWLRYPYLLLKTVGVLLRYRPELVFVQNPSVVLALFAVFMKLVLRFRVVVDSHNEGLKPFNSRHNWLLPFYLWIQKWANLTIVTNEQLAREVASCGGTPFVLEDRIPQMKPTAVTPLSGACNIVFVCTFEKDEPYREVIASARYLAPSIFIYITGKYQKASPYLIESAPANVLFPGFLPEQEYINLLHSSDIVMDLTLMEDCLVCGAYEAVALQKPMILSDTLALKSYFCRGAVYTQSEAKSIAMSVYKAIRNKQRLEKEVAELRRLIEAEWNLKYQNFLNKLNNLFS